LLKNKVQIRICEVWISSNKSYVLNENCWNSYNDLQFFGYEDIQQGLFDILSQSSIILF